MSYRLNFRRYLQLPVLHEHVCALEEEFWHADGGYEQIEAEDMDYILLMLQFRWDSIGRWCLPHMEDCTLKELMPYYFILNNIFDEYDPIPEYEEARSKWNQLIDQRPGDSFISKHSKGIKSYDLEIPTKTLESYPSYITKTIIHTTMKEKPNGIII